MSWDDILKGSNGADYLNGGGGDDFIQGRAGGDTIDGGTGHDQLHGDSGDDHIRGGAGNDFIHGGIGIDTAYYSGSVVEYSHHLNGEEFFLSHVAGTGADGHDRLLHVERLVFADAVIDLTQNNAPIAFNDSAATNEDVGTYSSGSASVLANDFDWEGDTLSATPGTFTGSYGTLVMNANGTYTYSPNASAQSLAQSQIVQDSFTYTVSDGSLTDTATLTINLAGLNDAPVANADSASTGENSAVTIDVLANDSDVDNGAVLTVTAASGPAGKGSVSIVGNQVKFDPGSDFDHLAQGASEAVLISYTIKDEHGATSNSTVTVEVTGANDGPVAAADTASGHENQVLTVDVLANDSDVDDGAVLSVVAASAPAGKGSASIVGNQVRFDPGDDFDHLADGASEVVVVSYTMEDEHGASASSTLKITVTGTNDGPVANPDSASTGENDAVTVDVLANDTDADDGAVLTVVAASGPAGQGNVSVVGNQVKFDPGADFDHLAAGESAQVEIGYTVEDEHGASSSSTLTVTVNGANDAPTIDAAGTTASGSANELANGDPNEGTQVHQSSGTIAFDDVDLSDTHGASVTPQGGAYLGTFTLDPVDQNGDSVGWDFSVSDAALDGLDEGEVVTQTYTIEIDDGHGGTTSQDVTITLTGAGDNQPPDAVNDSYSATGNVTLTVNAADGVLANDSDDAGVGDGPGETPVTAYDTVSANGGSVTMNPDGSFSYTSAPGFGGSDSFTYTITDAEGETDTATVSVTVTGGVWFIDNSAVGSANLGTQADPYTSLAAFNAAQGTPTGPGAGDTVYLRQGTGTYAEADGINLLSGQTLIGGGQDLVIGGDTIELGTGRPTIVATGAGNHGVQVATNNNVSGLDIGNTAGAGISDNNSTVGNLTVTDVGIFGSGRIVDIDQGGTVNITLNSAASTGSTGGAIDLNGLSGSFTVTGSTTIAGTHSGGGVDVTNGTNLNVAFQGTLTASTGSATAVNYTGSSGGGLTVGGTGNTIATTGGIAVNLAGVSNVAIADATISSSGNYAILGTTVAGFELSDSTVTGAASKDATIAFTNLSGTADLLGNTIAGGGGDNVRVVNNTGTLDLTIADGADQAVIGLNDAANGDDGVYVETGGSASLTLTIDGVEFLGSRSDLVQTVANGSSTHDITITDNVFANAHSATASGGGGVFIGGAGSNISVDYVVEGNSFTGADGSALSAYFTPAAGTIRGYIADNVIGVDDGVAGSEGSSGGGDGIFVGLEKLSGGGTATHTVTIDGNEVYDIAFGLGGINVRSGSAGGTGAVVEATVTDNVVDEIGAFTAFYSVVGGSSATDSSKLGIDMSNNEWDAGDSPFGNNAITFDQISENAHYYFPGYAGSADGEYSAGAGTASADLDAFLAGKGNVMTNGGFPLHPGGVDASLVMGVTGDALTMPVWFG